MGGKASRNKGKRGEYGVRDALRELGYTCNRVPLSGASQGYKGDIYIENLKLHGEVKVRHNEFKSIYAMFEIAHRPEKRGLLVSYSGKSVIMSEYFQDLQFDPAFESCMSLSTNFDYKKHEQTLKKLFNLKKFVKECDFLVIKCDHKPYIYLRYI